MIPERAILISTEPGDIVFDPFGGGGTTYEAAELHHRSWIGTELYDCASIRTRLVANRTLVMPDTGNFKYRDLFDSENQQDKVLRWRKRESL